MDKKTVIKDFKQYSKSDNAIYKSKNYLIEYISCIQTDFIRITRMVNNKTNIGFTSIDDNNISSNQYNSCDSTSLIRFLIKSKIFKNNVYKGDKIRVKYFNRNLKKLCKKYFNKTITDKLIKEYLDNFDINNH